jgi:hypothetical protein
MLLSVMSVILPPAANCMRLSVMQCYPTSLDMALLRVLLLLLLRCFHPPQV